MAPFGQKLYASGMGDFLWIHPGCEPGLAKEIASLDAARAYENLERGALPGRGTTGCLDMNGRKMLLKREERGGISRFLLPGRYLRREPFIVELHLSAAMEGNGLAPRVVARWFFTRMGMARVYTLIEPIEGAVSLLEVLAARKQGCGYFSAAGDLVGRLHALGVLHGDLNAGNILFDGSGKAWAIDWRHSFFFTPVPDAMRLSNLLRLERSITKIAASAVGTLPMECWRAFADGYDQGFGGEPDGLSDQWLSRAGHRFVLRRALWTLAGRSGPRGQGLPA